MRTPGRSTSAVKREERKDGATIKRLKTFLFGIKPLPAARLVQAHLTAGHAATVAYLPSLCHKQQASPCGTA